MYTRRSLEFPPWASFLLDMNWFYILFISKEFSYMVIRNSFS